MTEPGSQTNALAAAMREELDNFVRIGRSAFLSSHAEKRSARVFIRWGEAGVLCDAAPILRAAKAAQGDRGHNSKIRDDDATYELLDDLGFEVVLSGADWQKWEVEHAVTDYFDMLALEARGEHFVKSRRNHHLRMGLRSRSKGSVELKHQNISAVLFRMGLPFVRGYKPRGNVQALLIDVVQRFVKEKLPRLEAIVDDYQASAPAEKRVFVGALVDVPTLAKSVQQDRQPVQRVARHLDFAHRDDMNRKLGRAGEEWVMGFEAHRLASAGMIDLASSIEWTTAVLGDGAGYDVRSHETRELPRFIEVKTTNGAALTPFYMTGGEIAFSNEAPERFYLYRVFDFRRGPRLFVLQGEVDRHVHFEPVNFRARLKAVT